MTHSRFRKWRYFHSNKLFDEISNQWGARYIHRDHEGNSGKLNLKEIAVYSTERYFPTRFYKEGVGRGLCEGLV